LNKGLTIAYFKQSGKIPEDKLLLHILANCQMGAGRCGNIEQPAE